MNRIDWRLKLSAARTIAAIGCSEGPAFAPPAAAATSTQLTASDAGHASEGAAGGAALEAPSVELPVDAGLPEVSDASSAAPTAQETADVDADDAGVVEPLTAVSVSTFGSTTCALMDDGTARCWGYNKIGSVGDGSRVDRTLPTKVRELSDVMQLDVDYTYACALLSTGAVRCLGNDYGVLQGDGWGSSTPVTMPGYHDVTQLSVGEMQLCVRHRDATMDCSVSVERSGVTDGNGSSDVIEVEAGYFVSTARFRDGSLRSWGKNRFGSALKGASVLQMSSGYLFQCALLADRTVRCSDGSAPKLSQVQRISSGFEHTCALLANGSVQCWGNPDNGRLGNGDTGSGAVIGLPPVVEIASGDAHSCARTADGSIYCWGDNTYGQLGDGTKTERHTAVRVKGL